MANPNGSVAASSGAAAGFSAAERRILGRVEEALAIGLELQQWWEGVAAGRTQVERFDLISSFNRPAESYEFFGVAPVSTGDLRVMGNYQEMFYDHPKARPARQRPAADWMQDQVREFVLRYFMRISDFRQPEVRPDTATGSSLPPLVRELGWCPQEDVERGGFGFTQLFYKRADTGEIGRFPPEKKYAIVDLREIGTRYQWIVTRVRIFDFNITVKPLGSHGPTFQFPLREDSYLVTSRELVTHGERPAPGVLGRYGFGYAFISDPSAEDLLVYGPSQLQPAFETIDFEVLDSGEVRVEMAFTAYRPDRILNLNLDPVDWGLTAANIATLGLAAPFLTPVKEAFDRLPLPEASVDPVFGSVSLANLLTGGLAARELCISREQLEKDFLIQHFMQHYEMAVGSLLTWRQIPDWLDRQALPKWVITGVSS